MGLLSKEVEIQIAGGTIEYYESLGYEIPRYYNKDNHEYLCKQGTKIKVKVSDLKPKSNQKVKVQCDSCGKIYLMGYCQYTKQNHDGKIYCCNCANGILNSGENHCNYKPELTEEDRLANSKRRNLILGYQSWIKKVLARDNYTCQKCGKTHDKAMVAHHIDSYDWCKEKRMDITNGIALCGNCHKNFHSLYGYGQNTKEQFKEWLGKPLDDILREFNGKIPTMRPIVCLETKEIITNTIDYAKQHNIDEHSIWKSCTKGTLCLFKHFMYYNDYKNLSENEIETIIKTNKNARNTCRKVVQLDLNNGSIIAIYNQLRDAVVYNNITGYTQGIGYCANHVYKYSHGYRWEWFDYYCDNVDTQTKPSELLNKYLIEIERN